MNLQKLMLSTLLVLTTSLHAQDNIGWGPGSNPGRDPHRPQQPQQPQQPQRPQEPHWPQQPQHPQEPQRPQEPHWPRDPWENQGSNRDIELQLNQYYQGQSRVDLLQDAYTRAQIQGRRIQEITVIASSQNGYGEARLMVNGQLLERGKTVGRQISATTFRVDTNSNLRTLELELRGRFYVEKVLFRVLQGNGPINPGPWNPSRPQIEVVRKQLSEVIQGEGGLQLSRLFSSVDQRPGQVLRRINVIARSQRGSAQAQLKVNGQSISQAQSIGTYSTQLSFEVNSQLSIQSLSLYFRGTMVIEEVSLELERRN